MRLLAVAWVLLVMTSCRHAEPSKPAQPSPDAGPRELTTEATYGSPSSEAMVLGYAADCRATTQLGFYDSLGDRDAGECDARAFVQNCAPDLFNCWEPAEACRDTCAGPCHDCQAACGSGCEACKTGCDGGACLQVCARARLTCRNECLFSMQACRKGCDALLAKCETDAEARRARLCPDCDAITSCLGEAFEKHTPGDACLKGRPRNAAECLEWCVPPQ
jgi:hypothetical protein